MLQQRTALLFATEYDYKMHGIQSWLGVLKKRSTGQPSRDAVADALVSGKSSTEQFTTSREYWGLLGDPDTAKSAMQGLEHLRSLSIFVMVGILRLQGEGHAVRACTATIFEPRYALATVADAQAQVARGLIHSNSQRCGAETHVMRSSRKWAT
ncbi:MAG: hypothetical protein FRX48_07335 [Lasallia pustulata]|uniref:Uncharacterized protein n=1 Tax=Lasallia pustulata TaxID=136370 RepID=A0A5M8PHX9_9LECA|nr:MAG: hypothetical protein FRX48_07335 [Lasallia pustulata]